MTNVALIPTYEPDEHLIEVVDALARHGFECVVVDDGSGPGYASLLAGLSPDTVLLGYGENRGKGAALKLGLGYIQAHYPQDSVIVTVDGDGQHAPADALRCAEAAKDNPDAMVLGCRDFSGGDVPLRSRIGNLVTRIVFRLVSGLDVSDTQTGLRAFSARLVPRMLQISGQRYEYEMNELFDCVEDGVKICEVPVRTIYLDGNRRSHFRAGMDSLLIYRGIVKFVASSFASFLVDFSLFAVLSTLMAGLGTTGALVANVAARLVSATVNYNINRLYVFGSTEGVYQTAVRYALLACFILLANTLALQFALSLGIAAIPAKPCVEVMLFLSSWVLQNRVVFPRKEA